MAEIRANAESLIHRKSKRDGLKVYGKVKIVPPVEPGDKGYLEPLSKLSIEGDLTHAFYPSKWGYTWMFKVSLDQVKFIKNGNSKI